MLLTDAFGASICAINDFCMLPSVEVKSDEMTYPGLFDRELKSVGMSLDIANPALDKLSGSV